MALIDEIQLVKIGSTELLVQEIITSGGQKSAIHEFVNTNRTSVEDLGASLEQFTIRAIIHGDNYAQKIRNAQAEFTSGGKKTFIHKTLGTFDVKVLRPYQIVENESDFGVANITVRLQRVDDDLINPIESTPDESAISTDRKSVENMTASMIESQFTTLSGAASVIDVANKVLGFTNKISDIASNFQTISSKIDQFSTTINLIKGNVFSIIKSPLAIASSIHGVFTAFDQLFDAPGDAFDAYKGLFKFGDDDQLTPNNTLDYIARQQNINVINNTINANALARAYDSAVQDEYQTVDDIELVQEAIEEQYSFVTGQLDIQNEQSILLTRASGSIFRSEGQQSVIIGATTLTSTSGDADYDTTEDLIFVIDVLRNDSRLFFNTARLTTPQVIVINAPIAPAAVISYMVYGSTQFTEDLLELNGTSDTLLFGGNNLKVITG